MRRSFILRLFAASFVAFLASSPFASSAETMFPFIIDKGSPDNITNVQTWDQPAEVAGANGFIVDDLGQFADASGKKRLMGTNFCFGANFPSKEKAERVAATLARFGIGVVRLHHMDSHNIWGKNLSKSIVDIDPDELDKLDYLIYCFHKNGIYVDINLHVSRYFREQDGFENASKLPHQDKGVDNFCRKMIDLQKKYAQDLLQHVNPYTGLAYTDDPGVAVVEINNENSIVASWAWGSLENLPSPYIDEFQGLWNAWLAKRYGTIEALRAAWGSKTFPFGEELIPNVFGESFDLEGAWRVESDAFAKYSYRVLSAEESGFEKGALHIEIDKTGQVEWRPQLHCGELSVEKGKPYRVHFKVRSENGASFVARVAQDHDPWSAISAIEEVSATPEWKDVEFSFLAPGDDDQVRFTINVFKEGTSFDLAEVSMREGGCIGLEDGLTFADSSIPVVGRKGNSKMLGVQAFCDFADFMCDLENGYWQEMFQFVKGLGVKQLTTGTQLQYGYWYNQGRLEYCDVHAYWNHPYFPHQSWDGNDWFVKNTCMANHPCDSTLADLASARVIGRPLTCSEYDHPYPNQYAAEGNVMLAAVAAFQDWAATFQFAWSHGDSFERSQADRFFDMCSQTVKIAHLPACYAMFVRGDVKSGPGEFVCAPEMTEQKEREIAHDALKSSHREVATGLGQDRSLALAVYAGVELSDLDLPKSETYRNAKKISSWEELPERFGSRASKNIVNEFGEIRWNYQEKDKGFFMVDTANTKVFSGFVTRPCEFDAVTLNVGETELGWVCASLTKATNVDKDAEKNGALTTGRYLLTLTGDMRNTDEILKHVDADVTTAKNHGGYDGVAPVLCEGVPAVATLSALSAANVEVYALNECGDRSAQIEVKDVDGGASFSVGAEYKTIWYEVVVK